MPVCTHLDRIQTVAPSGAGCRECLTDGDAWTELRMCLTCGAVLCCDTSPNRHASAHAAAEDHPIVQSFELGESWRWCYVDRTYL